MIFMYSSIDFIFNSSPLLYNCISYFQFSLLGIYYVVSSLFKCSLIGFTTSNCECSGVVYRPLISVTEPYTLMLKWATRTNSNPTAPLPLPLPFDIVYITLPRDSYHNVWGWNPPILVPDWKPTTTFLRSSESRWQHRRREEGGSDRKKKELWKYDTSDIVLLKVSLVISVDVPADLPSQLNDPIQINPIETLTQRIMDANPPVVELKDPSSEVLDEFPELPAHRKVHIIVRRPPEGPSSE